MDIIGEYTTFYKYQKNENFKRFQKGGVQILRVFMFLNF